MGNRLSVTILSSIATEGAPAQEQEMSYMAPAPLPEPIAPPTPPIWEQQPEPEQMAPLTEKEPELRPVEMDPPLPEELIPLQAPVSIEAPMKPAIETRKPLPGPRVIVPKKKPVLIHEPVKPDKVAQAKQEVMQFEPVTRGRFEKSEPTIVEGQDLDVPTYLRKNVRVK
jgi:cell division protein FtsZ